jgi:hypothetical protein
MDSSKLLIIVSTEAFRYHPRVMGRQSVWSYYSVTVVCSAGEVACGSEHVELTGASVQPPAALLAQALVLHTQR